MSAVCTSAKAAEHHLKLGEIYELGEAGAGLERLAIRADLHRINNFAEIRGPAVEVVNAAALQRFLRGRRYRCTGVHFDHRLLLIGVPVANVTPWPGMLLMKVTALHEHIETTLATAGLDSGHPIQLRWRSLGFYTACASSYKIWSTAKLVKRKIRYHPSYPRQSGL